MQCANGVCEIGEHHENSHHGSRAKIEPQLIGRCAGGDPAKKNATNAIADAKEAHQFGSVGVIAKAPFFDSIGDNDEWTKVYQTEQKVADGKKSKPTVAAK